MNVDNDNQVASIASASLSPAASSSSAGQSNKAIYSSVTEPSSSASSTCSPPSARLSPVTPPSSSNAVGLSKREVPLCDRQQHAARQDTAMNVGINNPATPTQPTLNHVNSSTSNPSRLRCPVQCCPCNHQSYTGWVDIHSVVKHLNRVHLPCYQHPPPDFLDAFRLVVCDQCKILFFSRAGCQICKGKRSNVASHATPRPSTCRISAPTNLPMDLDDTQTQISHTSMSVAVPLSEIKFSLHPFRPESTYLKVPKGNGAKVSHPRSDHSATIWQIPAQFQPLPRCPIQFCAHAQEVEKPAPTAPPTSLNKGCPAGTAAVATNCGTKPLQVNAHTKTIGSWKGMQMRNSSTKLGGTKYFEQRVKETSAEQQQISPKIPPFSQ